MKKFVNCLTFVLFFIGYLLVTEVVISSTIRTFQYIFQDGGFFKYIELFIYYLTNIIVIISVCVASVFGLRSNAKNIGKKPHYYAGLICFIIGFGTIVKMVCDIILQAKHNGGYYPTTNDIAIMVIAFIMVFAGIASYALNESFKPLTLILGAISCFALVVGQVMILIGESNIPVIVTNVIIGVAALFGVIGYALSLLNKN